MNRTLILGLLRDWGAAILVVWLVMVVWSFFTPTPPSEGPAPALSLLDLDNQVVDLAKLEEDVVVVNFWATWCGPCRMEIPDLSAFHEEHPEVGLYGVSVDNGLTSADLATRAKRMGVRYPVLHDRTLAVSDTWGVQAYPTTFVLDASRNIRSVRVGPVSRKQLEAMVDQAR